MTLLTLIKHMFFSSMVNSLDVLTMLKKCGFIRLIIQVF